MPSQRGGTLYKVAVNQTSGCDCLVVLCVVAAETLVWIRVSSRKLYYYLDETYISLCFEFTSFESERLKQSPIFSDSTSNFARFPPQSFTKYKTTAVCMARPLTQLNTTPNSINHKVRVTQL